MLEKLREKRNEESGFTLVELLVVMLILGILAAIAVPAFFSQRDKGQDADAKAAVRTAQTAIESYATDNGGSYTGATVAILQDIEPTLNDATLSAPSNLSDTSYTVEAESDTGNLFRIETSGGVSELLCDTDGEGGCPSTGDWSGDAVAAP